MHIVVSGSLVALLALQVTVFIAEGSGEEMDHFLAQDWGFECRQSGASHVVRAVNARRIEEARARRFLSALQGVERLDIDFSRLAAGDIRFLAQSCPAVNAISFASGGGNNH